MTAHLEASYAIASILAGLLGAAAMAETMWLICRTGWAKGNMVVAVGSLVTGRREGSVRVGAGLHALSAAVFAFLYTLAIRGLGQARLPHALFLGIGFGIVHGLIVSLTLVWIVAERHPLEEFREAGLAVGLSHFAGHVAYGAMVGLVVGLLGPA